MMLQVFAFDEAKLRTEEDVTVTIALEFGNFHKFLTPTRPFSCLANNRSRMPENNLEEGTGDVDRRAFVSATIYLRVRSSSCHERTNFSSVSLRVWPTYVASSLYLIETSRGRSRYAKSFNDRSWTPHKFSTVEYWSVNTHTDSPSQYARKPRTRLRTKAST
ncbi:hypothetical protein EVG20_g8958 [Dentipellis fragilis]|uniref:Uncharacterized protein n=1 Tax=Dentipellis fragilis TaxID=205917 RepID=A0A4Y9Y265_9AGAM|nr:hypothetical protein EVG20_g8958 [Dentipellis fragilis]